MFSSVPLASCLSLKVNVFIQLESVHKTSSLDYIFDCNIFTNQLESLLETLSCALSSANTGKSKSKMWQFGTKCGNPLNAIQPLQCRILNPQRRRRYLASIQSAVCVCCNEFATPSRFRTASYHAWYWRSACEFVT